MADQPVTRTELAEALAATEKRILAGISALLLAEREKTQEAVRDAQTEILKAFLPFQESMTTRFRLLEVTSNNTNAGLSERMAIMERRLWEIEKRLLMNPPAA